MYKPEDITMLLMNESQIRSLIRRVILEAKKKKKRKTKKTASQRKAVKDLMLDKPFSTGGWPHGEDRGWLPDSDPVNVQVKDYLEDLGLL